MPLHSVSPNPKYAPYGTKASLVSIVVSRVMQGCVHGSTQSFREQLEGTMAQFSATIVPPSSQVQQTP